MQRPGQHVEVNRVLLLLLLLLMMMMMLPPPQRRHQGPINFNQRVDAKAARRLFARIRSAPAPVESTVAIIVVA